jgi:hypothetical protein
MLALKTAISKERLLTVIAAKERSFLDKIDSLMDVELSEGKWNKLYALLAQVRGRLGENIFVYESPNLYDYDTSCHRRYPHLFGDDRTALATMINPDPRPTRKKKPKFKAENWYTPEDKK